MPRSQFPRPPVRGSYRECDYAPRGQFGPREFGSTLAFSAAIQPAVIWASYQIERMAEQSDPTVNGVAVFGAAYGSTFLGSLFLKIAAGFLRNFGESVIRDLGAWLWINVLKALWSTFVDVCFGWLPGRTKKRWDDLIPDVHPDETKPPYQPVRDWWRNRRNH